MLYHQQCLFPLGGNCLATILKHNGAIGEPPILVEGLHQFDLQWRLVTDSFIRCRLDKVNCGNERAVVLDKFSSHFVSVLLATLLTQVARFHNRISLF